VGGQWCEEPDIVRREAKALFEARFMGTHDLGVRLGNVEFKSLSVEDNHNLISNFTGEEVKEAVW